MSRNTRLITAGIAVLAAAGAGFFYLRETRNGQPQFDRLIKEGAFELRAYPALLVAETVQAGAREAATDRGFRRLARYIHAEERGGEEIAMTAPVLVESSTDGIAGWKTRFIMPAKWTAETLPAPGREIFINDIPPRTIAAIRFSGRADDILLADQETALRRWCADRNLNLMGDAEYAFYNSPLIPGPLRRNEVLIEVAAIAAPEESGQ